MILARSFIVLALTVSVYGVARVNSTEELKRLARLPKIQLAPPLDFNRHAGFIIFPDPLSTSTEAAKLKERWMEEKSPEVILELGRTYHQLADLGLALRFYTQALDLFRRKLEVDPSNASLEASLGETLTLTGRLEEALPHLHRALSLRPDLATGWLALGLYHKEVAWRAVAGGTGFWGNESFLDALNELMVVGAETEQLDEVEHALTQASEAFDKAAELSSDDPRVFHERGTFRAFNSAIRQSIRVVRNGTPMIKPLAASLLLPEVIADYQRAAELDSSNPSRLGLVAFLPLFAAVYQESYDEHLLWQTGPPPLPVKSAEQVGWAVTHLQELAESRNREFAAAAAEILGSVQLTVLGDSRGALHNLRAAIKTDPERQRAWDLLTLELSRQGDDAQLVEHCSDRVLAAPSTRNYLFLAKAYDRLGEESKTRWTVLTALASSPNDFYANLALASVLLKRPDHEPFLPRVKDCLTRAERHIGREPTAQNQVDLALIKALYYALSDQPDTARTIIQNARRHDSRDPDLAAALAAIGY